jgi:hypothetical protein
MVSSATKYSYALCYGWRGLHVLPSVKSGRESLQVVKIIVVANCGQCGKRGTFLLTGSFFYEWN